MANKHVGVMLMTYGSPATLDDIPAYLSLLMICFVISAVRLHLTSILPSHRHLPHDQLGSI